MELGGVLSSFSWAYTPHRGGGQTGEEFSLLVNTKVYLEPSHRSLFFSPNRLGRCCCESNSLCFKQPSG